MQVKVKSGQQLNIAEFNFDDQLFDLIETPITTPNSPYGVPHQGNYGYQQYSSGQYGYFNGWRATVNMKPDYKMSLDWLKQNHSQIQMAMQAVQSSGLFIMSYSDLSTLKNLAVDIQKSSEYQARGLDFTNPLVIKAFETFLTVAKLHSETKHDE